MKLALDTFPVRLALPVIALLAGGCATGRTRLAVGNVGDTPILNVTVYSDSTELIHAPRLAIRSSSGHVRLTEPPAGETTVQWTGSNGKTYRRTLVPPEPVPGNFRGALLIEIGREDQARLFVVPEKRSGKQDIPWAQPESWEGYPGIPGMTHD